MSMFFGYGVHKDTHNVSTFCHVQEFSSRVCFKAKPQLQFLTLEMENTPRVQCI